MSFSMTYTSLMLTTPCEAVWGRCYFPLHRYIDTERFQRRAWDAQDPRPACSGTGPVLSFSEGCLSYSFLQTSVPGCLRSEAATVYSATLRGALACDGTGNHGDRTHGDHPVHCRIISGVDPGTPLWGGFERGHGDNSFPKFGSHGSKPSPSGSYG